MYLKISEWLQSTAARIKQKSIYFRLKHYIEKRQSYNMPVYSWGRCIGKSYTLVKLAEEYGLPIFTPSHASAEHLRSMAKSDILVIPMPREVKGLRYDIVLFDEGLRSSDILEALPLISRVSIGYVSERY